MHLHGSSAQHRRVWWKSHTDRISIRNIPGDPSRNRGAQDDRFFTELNSSRVPKLSSLGAPAYFGLCCVTGDAVGFCAAPCGACCCCVGVVSVRGVT